MPAAVDAGAAGTAAFERTFRRRFLVTAAAWALILGLLGTLAAYTTYKRDQAEHRAAVRQELLAGATILAARTAVAAQQVSRTSVDMAARIGRHDPPPPIFVKAVRRGTALARTEAKPRGTYFRTLTGEGPEYLSLLGAERVAGDVGSDAEIDGALGLMRALQDDLRSSPLVLQAGYQSGRDFFAMVERQPPVSERSILAYIRTKMPGASVGDFNRGAIDEVGMVRPRRDPLRKIVWVGPVPGQARKAAKLLVEAPVYDGSNFKGGIIMSFAASDLLRVPAPQQPGVRFLLLTKSGLLELGSFKPATLDGATGPKLAARVRPILAKAAAPGDLVELEGARLASVPIEGMPWQLVWAEPAATTDRWAVRAGLWIAAGLALVSLVALFSFLSFRRDYLKPALQLIGSANAPRGEAVAPQVNPIWRPVAEQLDRSRAETAAHVASLEEQYALTSAILRCSIDAIVTTDETGAIVDFNAAAERAFGWRVAEVAGVPVESIIPPAGAGEGAAAGLERFLSDGPARSVEATGRRRDGALFPLEIAVAETVLEDRRIFIGYLRDLSDAKAAQAELTRSREALHLSEKLAALGQLLAGVAHELNNPLAVVVGRSAILAEKLAGSPHARALEKLRAAADRCARIVATFLAMARQTGPRRTSADVNALVGSALELAAYGLRGEGIEVVRDFDPALTPIEADPDQIVQIVINLLVNAQQALEKKDGIRRLTVRTRAEPAAQRVTIQVSDNGPGVPDAIEGRIFEPFFTTKPAGSGTGLGLSVCKGMVEGHGGTLELVRTPGGGATFQVVLPLIPAAGSEIDAGSEIASTALRGRRVLIVDDEVEIAAVLADCLAPLGIIADISGNAAAAMERIMAAPYDAIFCDVRMPGTNGIAFYGKLRAALPAQAARFAFVSGDVLHRDVAQLNATAARPVVEKPFDPRRVRAVARALIEGTGA